MYTDVGKKVIGKKRKSACNNLERQPGHLVINKLSLLRSVHSFLCFS